MGDLADMYLKGRGTKADPVAAYAWFAQDESTNKDQLAGIASKLTAEQLALAKQQAEAIRRSGHGVKPVQRNGVRATHLTEPQTVTVKMCNV